MVKAPLQILTTRLQLSMPQAIDAPLIFESYASDPEVTRYLGWPRHLSLADTEGFLSFSAQHWERWPGGPYVIRRLSDGLVIGSTGFGFETPERASTGYVLAKDAWGTGFATEALAAMVDVAPRLGVLQLYALCHPDHRASRHILEKSGFTRDARWSKQVEFPNIAPGVLQDVLCYSLSF